MSTFTIVMLVIMVILLAAVIALYFVGKKTEKKQAENQAQLDAAAQQMTLLIIDKKKLRLKESGLPQIIIDQTPWYLKRSKVPIVKAKVGPKVMTMIADEKIFDMIPVKTQVKATCSGIYITAVRGMRGPLPTPPAKKKGIRAKMQDFIDRNKNK